MKMTELYSEKELDIIESHIEKRFGKYKKVFHEIESPDIHCDIAIIEPRRKHPYYTLVTFGAGAHRMNVPETLENRDRLLRAEYIINLPPYWKLDEADLKDEVWYWPIRGLKEMARYPAGNDTWLGHGHSMCGYGEGESFAPRVPFTAWMLTWPFAFGKKSLWRELPNGEEVNFYQLHPLYTAELEYKKKNGTDMLLDCFEEWEDDFLSCVSVTRPIVCKGKK